MAFFEDTFTGNDDTALQNHTPDTGDSWTRIWTSTDGTKYEIISNKIQQAGSANTGCMYTADATYPSADYDITCTMTELGVSTTNNIYLFVRVQDQENMYAVRLLDQGGTDTCQLYKKVSGTWSALGDVFTPPANGSVVKLEIIGSTLKFYDDGVEIASATDGDITSAGKAGIGGGGGAELVASGDDPSNISCIIDDLTVNDLEVVTTTSTSSTSSSTSSTSTSISTSSTSSSTSISTSSTSTSVSTSTSSTSTSFSTSSTSTSISTSRACTCGFRS